MSSPTPTIFLGLLLPWMRSISLGPHPLTLDVGLLLSATAPYSNTCSVQFSSVTQSCPTLCDPMNLSTPSLPVHHQLPEFTQIRVHRVSDAIQPSHPLLSPSSPVPNPSQNQSSKWKYGLEHTSISYGYFTPKIVTTIDNSIFPLFFFFWLQLVGS